MRKWLVRIAGGLLLLLLLVFSFLHLVGQGLFGSHEAPGEPTEARRPDPTVQETAARIDTAAAEIGVARPKQILFGDLHVHTTFSFDAFMLSLPVRQGEGAHPPADACDFARFCSALDFWSINDHAEAITPRHWRETVESIRRCNEVTGDAAAPDTMAFLGWEWTQVGDTPDDHYGHKNVVLAHTDEERIPRRPIAAEATVERATSALDFPRAGLGALLLSGADGRFHDMARYLDERIDLDRCEKGVPVRELPEDCLETAATPAELFEKLDDWGVESMVIPHGTTWGFYTPPGSTWDKQLEGPMHDPERQRLFEIYSGHGDSELHREWRGVEFDEDGTPRCPSPSPGYLPTCWRAGEIIRERCEASGAREDECEARALEARANAARALSQAHLTVPGARAEDWLDAGQCQDCPQASFNYRPGGSAQYVMALSNFDDGGEPRRFRFGFMSSSDNHFGRPGTGYKEVHRLGFSESRDRIRAGELPSRLQRVLGPPDEEPVARSRPFEPGGDLSGFAVFELERQGSFFMTGGLVAAHAAGRDRESVWQALSRREVYGTSGPRILLWFDLLNPPGATRGRGVPMGGEVEMGEPPIFQVRAVGSFEQRPGCPDWAAEALGAERLAHVCKNECYHPGDTRRPITRIEVVRIRPQQQPGEPVAPLIQDPWKRFECVPDPAGCSVTFSDPEFARAGRDTLYYVRAFEAEAPGVNAAGIACERDAAGRCIEADLCGDPGDGDCLAPHEPRAWSSPIFVDHPNAG